MSINPIQMQHGLSLPDFLAHYGTEAQCEEALKHARWPHGFHCPKCGGGTAREFTRGKTRYWECPACGHQTSLTSGTMMQQSQLPLTKWFLAVYLLTQSKNNVAALALRRELDITWRAAWLLKHKLMEAMRQREEGQPLSGDIRVDDAYLGGERTGGKPGRGSENKQAFVVSVEMRDNRPQRVRFDHDYFRWSDRFRSCSPARLRAPRQDRTERQGWYRDRCLSLAQCDTGKPQEVAVRDASCFWLLQICGSIPCPRAVSVQSAL